MLRVGWTVSRGFRANGSGILSSIKLLTNSSSAGSPLCRMDTVRDFSSILGRTPSPVQNAVALKFPPGYNLFPSCKTLLAVGPSTIAPVSPSIVRTVTKFSRQNGKRKSVKAVLKRFMRLDWGGWIRTKSGRNKKLWKKTSSQKRRLRQHVLTNSTQSWLLDSMVTNFWRRPKHYVNDPYKPYHTRDEFVATRK